MTTFVLVHGAWHGGWCYARTARHLRQNGHDVFTPTLTGVGERRHLATLAVNLSLHIEDVCNVIKWERLEDIVLCGHSYGGMVITGVADRLPGKVRSLVYLDAFVPENGKALWDYIADGHRQFFLETAAASGGAMAPIPAAGFNVNAADQAWVDGSCTPMSISCFLERLQLTGNHANIAKRTYVWAAGWGPSPFEQFHATLKGKADWTVVSVPCGHDVMVDQPAELARILEQAA